MWIGPNVRACARNKTHVYKMICFAYLSIVFLLKMIVMLLYMMVRRIMKNDKNAFLLSFAHLLIVLLILF